MSKKILPLFLSTLLSFPFFGINRVFAMNADNADADQIFVPVINNQLVPEGNEGPNSNNISMDDIGLDNENQNLGGGGNENVDDNNNLDANINNMLPHPPARRQNFMRKLGTAVKENPFKTAGAVGVSILTVLGVYCLSGDNEELDAEDADD